MLADFFNVAAKVKSKKRSILFAFLCPLTETDPRAAAVPVDEFDAGA